MTQEVQPLTWQKRTNIEEHMQFFSKINEIIANLAPTVDEAEAAIAQATQAVATANAASAAASAAASQAQTAASTVAGYDGRLTAAEDSIDTQGQQITVLQGRAGALETGMTALGTRMTAVEGREADYLKKAGAAQTVTSQIMVPTTATGTRDTQIANGTRIQNDLAAYEPMIRNTGNQTKAGIMTFTSPIVGQMAELAHFGSNTTAGWYAICKLPKQARELYIMTYTPGNLNFVMLETNTHVINVVKWVGSYAPNQNRFMWAETDDAMILYAYSATYRTNIISILNYSVYGTPLSVADIDKSVFTGQPVTKPEVGGDIIAVYDEAILNQVTA